VTRGETLNITVTHSDPASLHLGGDDVGYHLEVELSGSGTDTVKIDTYESTGPVSSYVEGGTPTLHTPRPPRPLAPVEYLVNVTIDGVEQDLGTVVVEPRKPMNASTYVAPGTVDPSETDAGGLREKLTRRERVARGDVAVIQLNESALESAFNPDDLSGGAAAEGIRVNFTQVDPPRNREPTSFTADADNVTVFPQFDRDQVLFAWNTSDVPVDHGPQTYEVAVSLTGAHNELVEEDRVVAEGDVTVVEPRMSISADPRFVLYPGRRNLSVAGETNLAPGRALEVRARSDRNQTFLRKHAVEVDANGTFAADFDFADLDRGIEFPLWVLGYRSSTEHTVSLPSSQAAVAFPDQETGGERVTIREAELPGGGFVALIDARERRRGVSEYLPPGTHENVTIRLDPALTRNATLLATAYFDSDANRSFERLSDRAYAPNNVPVVEAANVTLPEAARSTPTPEPTRTATPVSTATATPAATTAATPTSTPTPTPTPYPVEPETPLAPASEATLPLSPFLTVLSLLIVGGLLGRRTS
jgi:hypothetical protein